MIDAHVHLYDTRRPGGVPFPPPSHPLIYRPMLPADLREVAWPVGIRGAVVVESSPLVDDNQWNLDLVAHEPFICAVVGNLDPESEKFPELLARFAANPLYRGIRIRQGHALAFDSPLVASNLEALAAARCTCDVVLKTPDFPSLIRLATAHPGLRIMIDHLNNIPIDPRKPLDPAWVDGMSAFASLSNVFCKVSRFTEQAVQQPAPLESSYYTPTFDLVWNVFGPDRLVYGSNWPPCLESGDYCATVTLLRDYLREKHPEAVSRIMGRNAAAFYGGPRFAALVRSASTP
jgi:L-fuconolactonase